MNKDKLKEDILNKICGDIEAEYQMSGLSFGLYGDYAKDVARRFLKEIIPLVEKNTKKEMGEKIEKEFNKRQIWFQAGSPQTLAPDAYWLGVGFDNCLKKVKKVLDDILKQL